MSKPLIILPIILLVLLELAYLSLPDPVHAFLGLHADLWLALLALFPMIALAQNRFTPTAFRQPARRAIITYLYGAIAGTLWRLIELGTHLPTSPISIAVLPTTYYRWWAVPNAILILPLIEETLFRAYLQPPLTHTLGMYAGILVQAILFALFPGHILQGPAAVLAAFVFAIAAGWLYHRTKNLYPLLGFHGAANALPYIALLLESLT